MKQIEAIDLMLLNSAERANNFRRERRSNFAQTLFRGPRSPTERGDWSEQISEGFREWLAAAGPPILPHVCGKPSVQWADLEVVEKREVLTALTRYLANGLLELKTGASPDFLTPPAGRWRRGQGLHIQRTKMRLLTFREFGYAQGGIEPPFARSACSSTSFRPQIRIW